MDLFELFFWGGPFLPVGIFFAFGILVGTIDSLIKRKKAKKARKKYGIKEKRDAKAFAEKLLIKANDALKQKDHKKAFAYMEDSRHMDPDGKYPLMYSIYYAAMGDEKKRREYLAEAEKRKIHELKVIYADNALKRDEIIIAKKWCQEAADYHAYGTDEMNEKILSREKELHGEMLRALEKTVAEVRAEAAKANDLFRNQHKVREAAELYEKAYNTLEDSSQYYNSKPASGFYPSNYKLYSDTVNLLCTNIAMMHYNRLYLYKNSDEKKKKLSEINSWLSRTHRMSDNDLPEFYYVCAGLTYTQAGKYCYSSILKTAREQAEIAVKGGVPGAKELYDEIDKFYWERVDREVSVWKMEMAEENEFMKEHNGMSREEYREMQDERAENLRKANEAMAEKERRAARRNEIESEERTIDILTGGSGSTVDEKALRGEISHSDHALYDHLKEKYINKDN